MILLYFPFNVLTLIKYVFRAVTAENIQIGISSKLVLLLMSTTTNRDMHYHDIYLSLIEDYHLMLTHSSHHVIMIVNRLNKYLLISIRGHYINIP